MYYSEESIKLGYACSLVAKLILISENQPYYIEHDDYLAVAMLDLVASQPMTEEIEIVDDYDSDDEVLEDEDLAFASDTEDAAVPPDDVDDTVAQEQLEVAPDAVKDVAAQEPDAVKDVAAQEPAEGEVDATNKEKTASADEGEKDGVEGGGASGAPPSNQEAIE
ncbi:hypothetical protein Trihar35433_9479 [Trichoderma harzianum]|nr:hypothetical protein Trihar35433_9479 [Trichoderma harzianum]